MASILVLESDAAEREHAVHALEGAGHTAWSPSGDRPSPADLARADAVVAEIDAAVAAGLFRNGAPASAPLVLATHFTTMLPALGDRAAAIVRKPFHAETLVDAVSSVMAGRRAIVATEVPAEADAPRLETSSDPELTSIAQLVSQGVGTATGLVTILSGDHQVFAGHIGLPPDLVAGAETPRAWSFCRHAAAAGAPLVVPDAREHPAFADNPVVAMNLVRSYAGVPIEVPGYGAVGTVCVVSPEPRAFTRSDLAILELGARLASARLAERFAHEPPMVLRPSEPAPAIPAGELLGDQYYVTGRLGDGGQSSVLFARDRLTGQLVAIKVMRAALDEQLLVREAAALSTVRHANVVQVHGWGRTTDGRLYLVLEYVEGRTLADRLAEARATGEPLGPEQAMKIVREIGGALATLHAAGVVHGDLKPSNVILDAALDRAVLIDFGLGLGARRGRAAGASAGGTPGYSAPEQLVKGAGGALGETVDVYGLAALAYAALVGVGPFERVRPPMRPVAQLHADVAAPSALHPGLPEGVDRVLLRALSAEPEKRQSSVLAFVDALEAAMEGASPPSRATIGFEPRSRGLLFHDYRRTVRATVGEQAEAALFASLPAEVREAFDHAAAQEEFYPTAPLVAYLRAYAAGDLGKLEALGQALSPANIASSLTAMRVARTPESVLHVVQPLMSRFHDWGRLAVDHRGPREATLHVQMPREFAPEMCHYLAGVARSLLATSGRKARVSTKACMADGAEECEIAIQWGEG
ncbi:MAG TPA: protein kinase [Polyangiaceae bacterium]